MLSPAWSAPPDFPKVLDRLGPCKSRMKGFEQVHKPLLPIFRSDGLLVRPPSRAGCKPMFDYRSLPDVSKYQSLGSRVRLRMGGSWLWGDDLGEGLVLDELLATTLRINAAVLLARQARGRRASLAKRAAARKNGRKGRRPRKVAARATSYRPTLVESHTVWRRGYLRQRATACVEGLGGALFGASVSRPLSAKSTMTVRPWRECDA